MGAGLKTSFLTGLTETFTTDKEGIGALRFDSGVWYKWVLFVDGTANLDIVAGDALYYEAVTGYGLSRVVADLTDADTLALPAGVCHAAVTVDLTYMWMAIKGAVTLTVTPDGPTPADGDALGRGTTDKAFGVDPADNASGCGILLDASAKTAVLDCIF